MDSNMYVKILSVNKKDAYYHRRNEFIGKIAILTRIMIIHPNGCIGGTLKVDGIDKTFHCIKVTNLY